MMKTRLLAMFMASLVLLNTSCSETETPQPVEDTERIDQLRNELRAVQEMIYGAALENALLTKEGENLTALMAELEAEIARLQEQYDRSVTYTVITVDNTGNPIANANVTLNQNGTLVTKATDASGSVQIEDVRAGTIAAVVKAEGYATVNYFATLAFADAGVNSRIVMIPKVGPNTYSVKGFLYANTNVANDTLVGHHHGTPFIGWQGTDASTNVEGPNEDAPFASYDKVNKKITATLFVSIDYVPFSRASGDGGNSADIIEVAYEDASVEAVFDANNQFTLTLPVTSIFKDTWGDNVHYIWNLSFEQFVSDQTLVDFDENGVFWDGAPRTAYPKPATYVARKLFYRNDSHEYSNDEHREAGDVVSRDFFYSVMNF